MYVIVNQSQENHLFQVRPDVQNEFRIVCFNKYGASEPSSAVAVLVRAGPPLMASMKPSLSDIKPRSLTVAWTQAENQIGFIQAPITYRLEMR